MAVVVKQTVNPRYRYNEYYKKPVDEQISMLSQIIQDVYYQMQGIPANGWALPSVSDDEAFAFMAFDP